MLKIKEAIIVEGRYDKIKLGGLVDAPVICTNGFRVFSDKEKQSLIRQIADMQGPCDRSLKSEVPCGSCLNWR